MRLVGSRVSSRSMRSSGTSGILLQWAGGEEGGVCSHVPVSPPSSTVVTLSHAHPHTPHRSLLCLPRILILEASPIDLLEFEGAEVGEFDDPRPFCWGGGPTQSATREHMLTQHKIMGGKFFF